MLLRRHLRLRHSFRVRTSARYLPNFFCFNNVNDGSINFFRFATCRLLRYFSKNITKIVCSSSLSLEISNFSAAFSRRSSLRKPYTCTATPSRPVILTGSLCFIAVWLNRLTVATIARRRRVAKSAQKDLSRLNDRSNVSARAWRTCNRLRA